MNMAESLNDRIIVLRYGDLVRFKEEPEYLEILIHFYKLNIKGQMRFAEYLKDLTEIPKYRKDTK